MEGGRNGMEQYNDTATIEKACWQLRVLRAPEEQYDEGNAATIEKHAFDIAKKRLGDNDDGTTISLEIGGRNGERLDYAKSRREQQYDKPPWSLPDEGDAASLYADKIPHHR